MHHAIEERVLKSSGQQARLSPSIARRSRRPATAPHFAVIGLPPSLALDRRFGRPSCCEASRKEMSRMPKPQGKKLLVTGGTGFLGSHLCERLLELGHDLLCVDNFFTGSKANVAHLLK